MNTLTTRRRRGALLAGSLSVAAVLALTGCSQAEPEADPTAAEDIELTFLNQSRGQEAALTQLAEQYTEETGVKITIDSPGPADYLPKLQARAQSRRMPDIYSSFSATDMAPFYKAGWAMDLDWRARGRLERGLQPRGDRDVDVRGWQQPRRAGGHLQRPLGDADLRHDGQPGTD